jgi:hypothetical protein
MKKILITAVLLLATTASVDAALPRPQNQKQRQQRPQNLAPGLRPNGDVRPNPNNVRPALRRNVAEDAVYGVYMRQLARDPEFSPEIRARIQPFLDRFLEDRFEVTRRRTRALNQLRQAMARNASDDEISGFVREIDNADSEFLNAHERYLMSVDPILTPRQRARMRLLQEMSERMIRQTLDALQNPNAQRQPADQPPREN